MSSRTSTLALSILNTHLPLKLGWSRVCPSTPAFTDAGVDPSAPIPLARVSSFVISAYAPSELTTVLSSVERPAP